MKKKIKYIVLSIIGFILIIMISLVFIFKDELQTLKSVKKVSDYPSYTMTYHNDYNLNGLLKQGVSNDNELIKFASKNLLKGFPLSINIPKVGCTTFTAHTSAGNNLFGRNFDLEYSPSMLVKTEPKHGYKSISIVDLRFLGIKKNSMNNPKKRILALAAPYIPFDGINEKGVSAAVLWVPDKTTNQRDHKKSNITTSIAIRMILDKAKNTKQAIKLLKEYNMHASAHGCYHFQISDAKGRSAIVEYQNNKMSVLPQQNGHQVLTNFYKTKGKKYLQGQGHDRYTLVERKLNDKHGELSEKQAMQLLDAAHNGPGKHFKEKSNTQWSVVYNNTKKSADVVIGRNYNKVKHYNVN